MSVPATTVETEDFKNFLRSILIRLAEFLMSCPANIVIICNLDVIISVGYRVKQKYDDLKMRPELTNPFRIIDVLIKFKRQYPILNL